MDFSELLKARRSVRSFEDKAVPLELIQEIIKDSTSAPNAGNMQLWRFVIVNSKAQMKKISDVCKKTILGHIERDPDSNWKGYARSLGNEDFNVFHNAPAVVYIVGTAKSATITADCSILATYFMLSAADKGLGTCWIAQGAEIGDPAMREEMGIPENYAIVAPIILGYPKDIPAMPERREPKILKVIS